MPECSVCYKHGNFQYSEKNTLLVTLLIIRTGIQSKKDEKIRGQITLYIWRKRGQIIPFVLDDEVCRQWTALQGFRLSFLHRDRKSNRFLTSLSRLRPIRNSTLKQVAKLSWPFPAYRSCNHPTWFGRVEPQNSKSAVTPFLVRLGFPLNHNFSVAIYFPPKLPTEFSERSVFSCLPNDFRLNNTSNLVEWDHQTANN
jgi:hypothetical protein